jgi:hypothetical protein
VNKDKKAESKECSGGFIEENSFEKEFRSV